MVVVVTGTVEVSITTTPLSDDEGSVSGVVLGTVLVASAAVRMTQPSDCMIDRVPGPKARRKSTVAR